MVKVLQLSRMTNAEDGSFSTYQHTETWVNPSYVRMIEDLRPFGSHWAHADYLIHLVGGLEVGCIGNPQDFIEQMNAPVAYYSKN
jgi:hypothetical protein